MLPLFQEYPVCPHFGPCAGCTEDLSLTPPPVWDEVVSFLSPYQIPVLHQGPSIHWRHRAKMAVRGVSGKPLIGLFKRELLPRVLRTFQFVYKIRFTVIYVP